jgi:branched-chain amino acid transport system ATP-binding protein
MEHGLGGEAILEVRDLGVAFGGVQALDGVNLAVSHGEIVGLIGPNGAGKSTLLDCVNGFTRPDRGAVFLRGADVTRLPPYRRARAGIGRTFQHLGLCRDETVLENVTTAQHRVCGYGAILGMFGVGRRTAERRLKHRAVSVLEPLGLVERMHDRVRELPAGLARLVEFACALAPEPALVLLDEPSAGLARAEADCISEVLREIRDDHLVSVLLVGHDTQLVMSVADRVVVLSSGRVLASGTPAEVRADPAVAQAYLGSRDVDAG